MKKTRNRFEKRIQTSLKRAKVFFGYESEKIPYVIASHYIPDFVISTPTGKVYLETKGYLRPEDKRKLVAVKRQHPAKDIRILFYSLNQKYIKWADRVGIRWAVGKIPREWLEGL